MCIRDSRIDPPTSGFFSLQLLDFGLYWKLLIPMQSPPCCAVFVFFSAVLCPQWGGVRESVRPWDDHRSLGAPNPTTPKRGVS